MTPTVTIDLQEYNELLKRRETEDAGRDYNVVLELLTLMLNSATQPSGSREGYARRTIINLDEVKYLADEAGIAVETKEGRDSKHTYTVFRVSKSKI